VPSPIVRITGIIMISMVGSNNLNASRLNLNFKLKFFFKNDDQYQECGRQHGRGRRLSRTPLTFRGGVVGFYGEQSKALAGVAGQPDCRLADRQMASQVRERPDRPATGEAGEQDT
jgi:hypothetical protein